MRNQLIGSCVLAAALALVGAGRALGQDAGATVGASYDVLYHEFSDTSAAGVHFDVAKSVGMVSAVGEIGFNHFDGATVSSFLAGGRWGLPSSNAKLSPFVQVLVGAWRCGACDLTELALQPGFGVDFMTSKMYKIRGQVDLRHIFSDFDDENAYRLSVGAVFNVGGK
jgi:hypothetical protein